MALQLQSIHYRIGSNFLVGLSSAKCDTNQRKTRGLVVELLNQHTYVACHMYQFFQHSQGWNPWSPTFRVLECLGRAFSRIKNSKWCQLGKPPTLWEWKVKVSLVPFIKLTRFFINCYKVGGGLDPRSQQLRFEKASLSHTFTMSISRISKQF